MGWKTLDDMDFAGKRALVRVDINVPVDNGVVTDTSRIERIIPTVDDIHAQGGKVILLAHFDRPKGKVVPEMSLEHIAALNAMGFNAKVYYVGAPDGFAKFTVPAVRAGAPLLSDEVHKFVIDNADVLDSAIVYDRDFTYDYFGFKTLQRSYLFKMNGKIVERP